MTQLYTPEEFNQKFGNQFATAQSPATSFTAIAPSGSGKSGFCPVRHAQQMDARHKLLSILHLVGMVLVVLLLFRLVFKG